jgi:hypothetical protein
VYRHGRSRIVCRIPPPLPVRFDTAFINSAAMRGGRGRGKTRKALKFRLISPNTHSPIVWCPVSSTGYYNLIDNDELHRHPADISGLGGGSSCERTLRIDTADQETSLTFLKLHTHVQHCSRVMQDRDINTMRGKMMKHYIHWTTGRTSNHITMIIMATNNEKHTFIRHSSGARRSVKQNGPEN